MTESERQQLQGWTRRLKTVQALALRARIVACAKGLDNRVVAQELAVIPQTVSK